jgi:hypothetical protein
VVIIGVDSSGHVKNPPIWMAAARTSKKSGQLCYGVYISPKKHDELENICRDWADKVSAILIYKAVLPIFFEHDAIFIDTDFQGKGPIIEKHVKKLLRATYPRIEALANPTVYFIPENKSDEVKDAHIKSQRMRHKIIPKFEKDPSFSKELQILG